MVGAQIGSSARRVGGHDRVTGAQKFVADLRLDEMLYVKLVSLDCARARLLGIDASEALAVPGVVAVVSAEDLPQPVARFGPVYRDRPVLAVRETKYHGEPVVAVIAETIEAAELAASLVEIRHEELRAVFTVDAALNPSSPLVQEPELRPNDPLASTNVLRERHYGWGNVDAANAELVVENSYSFPMVTHFAIEPVGCIVAPQGQGLDVWSPVQHPYQLQRILADLFEMPLARMRVFAPDPGGSFGGKQNPKFEPLLCFLALQTKRPVRLVLTLEETFQAMRRTSAEIHVRSGFRNDGTLLFQDIESNYLIGAYVDIAERVVSKSNYLACGPYRTPAARIRARAILSHTTPSCAFRGFGTPQINWAVESQMDEAARRLGLDGLSIRQRNLANFGEEIIPGDVPADGVWSESLEMAATAIGWAEPLAPGRGRGIAVGIKPGATSGLSYSTVRLLFDGSALVYAGTSDMGQGARTIFAQIVADEISVELERVTVVMGDTATVPFDLQTSASRSTVFMGNAIVRACHEIQTQLRKMAADLFDVSESDVAIEKGRISVLDQELSAAELLTRSFGRLRGELIGNGVMRQDDVSDHPLGGSPSFYEFNCTAFEVEVDRDTGEILVVKHVSVSDVGRALNPLQVEMQDEGAAIMGLGHSLMEQIILDSTGRIRNLGALDYRIPTTKDVPLNLHSFIVENGDGPGPYGSKGVAEGGLLCTAPALASAVAAAAGVVIRDLPLTSERVWQVMQGSSDKSPSRVFGTRTGKVQALEVHLPQV